MQFILILLVTALACVTAASRSAPPVVAIVSHPYNSTHEYIATSYIKNMELAGARVVRVPYNGMDEDGLDWIKKNTNGLFLMGGGSSLTDGVKELFKTVREVSAGTREGGREERRTGGAHNSQQPFSRRYPHLRSTVTQFGAPA